MNSISRSYNRQMDQLRPLKVTYGVFLYAAGSTLFELGNTKVLCSITCQQGVPHFLKGKKTGWLTAEYSLLPVSTPIRTVRDSNTLKRNGRNIEISRLIGRALRSVLNLDKLGEYTIFVDCDVMQADGGTRTASITGAYLALKAAVSKWKQIGFLKENIIRDDIAAVSVGVKNGLTLLDLDFSEDSEVDADYNFVLTRSSKIVEIQGSAEKSPLSWNTYDSIKSSAIKGVNEIFEFYDLNSFSNDSFDNNVHKFSSTIYEAMFE